MENQIQVKGKATEVKGTPFWLVQVEINKESNVKEYEEKTAITMGKEILKIMNNEEEAKKYINKKPWELILNAAYIYTKFTEENGKNK